MLSVLQQPNILNPLNASVWYKVNSNLNQIVDFKYVFDVYIKNKSTGNNETYIGRFEAPPRPGDGAGFFSPHKSVRALAYREVKADLTSPQLAEPNYERFGVNIGEKIPQSFNYYDTYFASSFVAFTFSYQHPFVNGQILYNTQDNSDGFGININPDYEGTFSITSVPNDFAIITNIPWNLSTPQQLGDISVPFTDTWDYISTNGTIGITFSGPHTLQIGDIIEIDKDDKTWNTWLDGEWEVLQVFPRSVRLNRGVPLGSTYSVGVDSGFITKVTRFGHTGTSKWGYLGTRQYDELNVDFSPQFYCGSEYLSSNGATAAGFMTDYDGRKPTWGEPETSSIFLTNGVWYPILRFTPPVTFTGNLIGAGSGTGAFNGTWTLAGTLNGRNYWTRSGATMSWTGSEWQILNDTGYYFYDVDVPSPLNITSGMWLTGQPTGNVIVSGAGFSDANGTYVPNGVVDGKTAYLGGTFNNIDISWNAFQGRWYITDTNGFYYADEDVEYPWEVLVWLVDGAPWFGPAPTMTQEGSGSLTLPGPNFTQQTSGGSPVQYQQIFTASTIGQYHFPSGVPNVEAYWNVSLSGIKNYEIYLSDIAIL